jgi:hypothetical protein
MFRRVFDQPEGNLVALDVIAGAKRRGGHPESPA